MTVEIEFENEIDDEDLPVRLRIARPALRENLEEYLAEKVKKSAASRKNQVTPKLNTARARRRFGLT